MSADNVTDLQGWIILFAIIGGIITVGTAGWRIINFLRTETKEAITEEHKFNVDQHTETRTVVKDALQGIDEKLKDVKDEVKEVKSEVSKLTDVKINVAVHEERLSRHEDAISFLNRIIGHKDSEKK